MQIVVQGYCGEKLHFHINVYTVELERLLSEFLFGSVKEKTKFAFLSVLPLLFYLNTGTTATPPSQKCCYVSFSA